jgi:hypothetical protein
LKLAEEVGRRSKEEEEEEEVLDEPQTVEDNLQKASQETKLVPKTRRRHLLPN